MKRTTQPAEVQPGPRLELVPMAAIFEPEVPVRSEMGEKAMDELVESMRDNGLLSPIKLKPVGGGQYEIIYGHRRYLAARRLHWNEILALIGTDGAVSVEAARIHENAVREAVNAADEAVYVAEAYEKLKLDEEGLCKLFHRSPAWIGDRWQLLKGDPDIFQAVRSNAITFAVARELNRLKDPVLRKDYLHHAASGGNSARVVHEWVERANATPPSGAVTQVSGPAVENEGTAEPPPVACNLCGGSKDPSNLTYVLFHVYCLDHLKKVLAQGAEEAK